MIRALLCKLPTWAGGGHRWTRAKERGDGTAAKWCRRCQEIREVKRRKVKHD